MGRDYTNGGPASSFPGVANIGNELAAAEDGGPEEKLIPGGK